MSLDLLITLTIPLLITALAMWQSRGRSRGEDFLVAARDLGLILIVGSLVMSDFTAMTMVSQARFGYTAGPYGTMVLLSFFSAMFVFVLVFAKRWHRLQATSASDLFGQRYGRGLKHLSATFF